MQDVVGLCRACLHRPSSRAEQPGKWRPKKGARDETKKGGTQGPRQAEATRLASGAVCVIKIRVHPVECTRRKSRLQSSFRAKRKAVCVFRCNVVYGRTCLDHRATVLHVCSRFASRYQEQLETTAKEHSKPSSRI